MLPKAGNRLHRRDELRYALQISAALRTELGDTHRATKTLMRWTGASERSAKNWLSGSCTPSGPHMIILLRESDLVARAVLGLAGRDDLLRLIDVQAAEQEILSALEHVRAALGRP